MTPAPKASPMTRLLTHLRNNSVAYVALFVALSGTSYAALSISGSQIRNRTIDAIKLNPKTISASVRAWVIVQAGASEAKSSGSSGPVRVSAIGNGESITWPHRRFGRNCLASVTPQLTPAAGPYGSVTVQFSPAAGTLIVRGFGPDKLGRPTSAYVMVICP
jgi:hypothetical protein